MDMTSLLTSFPAQFKVTCLECRHTFARVDDPTSLDAEITVP